MTILYRSFFCALVLVSFFWSCKPKDSNLSMNNNTPTELKESISKPLTFYYFPKANAYYDVTNASFIYSLDSGKNWTVLPDSSKQNNPILGKRFLIKSNTSDVWRDNEIHRKMYGGTLINLVRRDSVRYKSLKAKAAAKKAQLNADSILISEQPKKKRNFFQRLFGKRRKRD